MKIILIFLALTLSGCETLRYTSKEPTVIVPAPGPEVQEIIEIEEDADKQIKKILEGFMPSYSLY